MEQNIKDVVIDLVKLESKAKGWEEEWDKIQAVFDDENGFLKSRIAEYCPDEAMASLDKKFFMLYVSCCNLFSIESTIVSLFERGQYTVENFFDKSNLLILINQNDICVADLKIDRFLLETHGPYWQKEWKKMEYVFKEDNFLKERLPDYYSMARKESFLNDVYFYCFMRWKERKTQSPFTGIDTIGHIFNSFSIKRYQQKTANNPLVSCNTTIVHEIDKMRGTFRLGKKKQDNEQETQSPVKNFLSSKNAGDFYSDSSDKHEQYFLFECTDKELERVQNCEKDEYEKTMEDINETEQLMRQTLEKKKKEQITQALSEYFAAPRFQKKIMQNTDIDFCAGVQLYDNYNESVSPNDSGLCYLRNQTFSIIAEHHSSFENEEQSPHERLRWHIIHGYKILLDKMKSSIETDEMKEKNRRERMCSNRYMRRKKEQLFLSFMRWYHPIFLEDSLYDLGFTTQDSVLLWPQKYISFLGKNLKQWDKQPVCCSRKLLDGIKNGKFEENDNNL